ncbi:hypothetical protein ColLi_13411 [Colletotrichum liriopes]|uniref:C3H1-type domain-containing protein n=1 Tax=Colletotrichum liriopes TaxID=708192 RepID=A0AA37H060_9PEZI|nr:hypothetical protein ColLi_13411 [Colletotrichum liriopes]
MDHREDLTKQYLDNLETFCQVDRDRNAMHLIDQLWKLQTLYAAKNHDYDNEVESRRMWQTKVNNLAQEVATLKMANESNPFVFAIIDGDGAVFQAALLEKGADGGAEAGYRLRKEIENDLTNAYPEAASENWNIIVQVVLNVDGLAKKLHSSGIVSNTPTERTLADFGRGFGRAQPLFSFIDVGSGKESADHKIREMLRVMVRVAQCKHIFFGPCHDNGYLPVLEPYKLDPKVAKKFTLIETTPAEEGFKQLNFHIIDFNSVFMSEKLPERVRRPATTSKPTPLAVAAADPAKSLVGVTDTNSASNGVHLKTTTETPSCATSPPPNLAQTSTPWSVVSKAPLAPKTINISTAKKSSVQSYYLLNKDGQRVDEKLPKIDPAAMKSLDERMNKVGKFCNSYHLDNRCENETCPYVHGERLVSGDLGALKRKAYDH